MKQAHICFSTGITPLTGIHLMADEKTYKREAERQLDFIAKQASGAPMHHAMFLLGLLRHNDPPVKITVVPDEHTDAETISTVLPAEAVVILLPRPNDEYPLKNGKTTYYICKNNSCLPPVNDLQELI